jgi:hypothetical protein
VDEEAVELPREKPAPPQGALMVFVDAKWRPCRRDVAVWWTWDGARKWYEVSKDPIVDPVSDAGSAEPGEPTGPSG